MSGDPLVKLNDPLNATDKAAEPPSLDGGAVAPGDDPPASALSELPDATAPPSDSAPSDSAPSDSAPSDSAPSDSAPSDGTLLVTSTLPSGAAVSSSAALPTSDTNFAPAAVPAFIPLPLLPADQLLPGELPEYVISHHDGSSDYIPDVAASPTFVAPSGLSHWSDWGQNLGANDVVLIPEDAHVIYDLAANTPLKAVGVKGTLEFATDRSTQLSVGTILVYQSGSFVIENTSGQFTTDVVFDGQVDTTADPSQFTIGFLAIGGNVQILGHEVASPFSQLTGSFAAGSQTITIADATDWKPGDHLFFADTQLGAHRYDSSVVQQGEERVIGSIVGNQVTLTAPLTYAHEGYVGHLTRNVCFMSAPEAVALDVNPAPTKSRGHMFFTGAAIVDVEFTEFENLGRTQAAMLNSTPRDAQGHVLLDDNDQPIIGSNQIGRYPLHAHHLEHAFTWKGDVVDGALKWGMAHHESYGNILDNVVVNFQGAGIATEEGNESGLIQGNLVIGTGGGSGVDDVTVVNVFPKQAAINAFGQGGYGYWMASPLVNVNGNVVAGQFKFSGFTYFTRAPSFLTFDVPEGADPNMLVGIAPSVLSGAQYVSSVQPIISFRDNVADVVRGDAFLSYYNNAKSWSVDHFAAKVRGFNGVGVHLFYSGAGTPQGNQFNPTVKNSTILGPFALGLDPNLLHRHSPVSTEGGVGIYEDTSGRVQIENNDVEGFDVGIKLTPGGNGEIIGNYLNNFRNIYIPWVATASAQVNIRDVQFGDLGTTAIPHENIYLNDAIVGGNLAIPHAVEDQVRATHDAITVGLRWLSKRTDVRVYNYNGTGQDFQVFFPSQAPDFVIPLLEITNQQAWDQLGVAVGDAVASGTATVPGVVGLVGAIQPPQVRWAYNAASSNSSAFRLNYSLEQANPDPLVPAKNYQERFVLQPGLNLVTRTQDYNGTTVTKTFVIWGNFTDRQLADADGDGIVNGADYTLWSDHLGQTTTGGQAVGDFNGDGIVNGADYTLWADQYGALFLPPTVLPVPLAATLPTPLAPPALSPAPAAPAPSAPASSAAAPPAVPRSASAVDTVLTEIPQPVARFNLISIADALAEVLSSQRNDS